LNCQSKLFTGFGSLPNQAQKPNPSTPLVKITFGVVGFYFAENHFFGLIYEIITNLCIRYTGKGLTKGFIFVIM
jgi:hypothetical protein